ncbi:MAG: DegT/DnrJ/EryC1/StrS family aminotransferase [Bacteroidales bacterium]|nr:DegT/DnrJ/EryC1/StrS family aminotransferase [Bacteroidales bacterium]
MSLKSKLAIDGGAKAKTTPNIPMYPGGLEIGEEEKSAVMQVLDDKYLFRYYGPSGVESKVKLFEEEFSEKIGVKHSLATNSCTSALICSLVALGIGPGDEVIVPGYTFFASCATIVAARAVPVIAEVDDSLTIDPVDIEKKITPRTKAIIVVHMRGVPCDMAKILTLASKYNLKVIEDVAQSAGGSFKGTRLGSFGEMGAFSFQYHKIITAGEGGMVTTNDNLLYDRAMSYHDTAACWRPGGPEKRFSKARYSGELFPGVNYRMNEITGAILRVQLNRLDGLISKMRYNKSRIKKAIENIPGLEFRRLNDAAGDTGLVLIFFLSDPEITGRFADALKAEGIAASSMHNKSVPDWHIYSYWEMILNKWTATQEGCPYTCDYYLKEGGKVNYSPDMNPNTLQYLHRSVHIDIPPQMTEDDCDMISEGILKVANAYL